MASRAHLERPLPPLYVVGPFPPPVSGQSHSTFALTEVLKKQNKRRIIPLNTIRGNTKNKISSSAIRAARVFYCATKLLTSPSRSNYYISVDANAGMIFTLIFSTICRLKGGRIWLHHHTYSHIIRKNPIMTRIADVCGRESTHICICKKMSDDLRDTYNNIYHTIELSNVTLIANNSNYKISDENRDRIVLGHMAKLSPEKGLSECIQVLEGLIDSGLQAELHLAGSVADSAKPILNNLSDKVREQVKLYGFVGDDLKENFFSELDYFIFPTKYENETQGIVNLEAMSFGTPVISVDRCCIASDNVNAGGIVFSQDDDFASSATKFILEYHGKKTNRRQLARNRFEYLHKEGLKQLDNFLCDITDA